MIINSIIQILLVNIHYWHHRLTTVEDIGRSVWIIIIIIILE